MDFYMDLDNIYLFDFVSFVSKAFDVLKINR